MSKYFDNILLQQYVNKSMILCFKPLSITTIPVNLIQVLKGLKLELQVKGFSVYIQGTHHISIKKIDLTVVCV